MQLSKLLAHIVHSEIRLCLISPLILSTHFLHHLKIYGRTPIQLSVKRKDYVKNILLGREESMCNWIVESWKNCLKDISPNLLSEDVSAFGNQTVKNKHSFAVLWLTHKSIFVFSCGYWCYAHLDNCFNCVERSSQKVTSIEDENLNGVKSLTEPAGILPIENLRNNFEHLLLIYCHLFSFVNKRSKLNKNYVMRRRISS